MSVVNWAVSDDMFSCLDVCLAARAFSTLLGDESSIVGADMCVPRAACPVTGAAALDKEA